jgi:hypothetical protein
MQLIVGASLAIGAGSGTELRLTLFQVVAERRRQPGSAFGAGSSRRAAFSSLPLRVVHQR